MNNLLELYCKSENELEKIIKKVSSMKVSLPIWLYLDAGTRFGKIQAKDSADSVWNAMDCQKRIHELTDADDGIVWGSMGKNDILRIIEETEKRGIKISTVHAYFSGEAASYGSVCNADATQRELAFEQIAHCIDLMRATGAKNLSLWFKDGTNYPGQADFTKRFNRMMDVFKRVYKMLDADMTMLIEYKLFEPAWYQTDIADWGTAVEICRQLGPRAKVIMDLGHHAQATNIPATLSSIIRSGKMGAIHFNDNKYADDDLIVGALDPYRLFLVFCELRAQMELHGQNLEDMPLIIDQSLVVEEKMPGVLYTIENMQIAYAKSLLVDMDKLTALQDANDVVGSARTLMKAFEYDVRPILKVIRQRKNLPLDPFAAIKEN